MSYATLPLLIERYGETLLLQVADRAVPPAGAIDSAIVDRVLADTDAVVDGYLAGRYVLPLETTPPLLADIAASIAIYKLHVYSPEQKIADEYRDAIASLSKIAMGTIRLPVAGIEPTGTNASGVVVSDRPRDFTPDNLRWFV